MSTINIAIPTHKPALSEFWHSSAAPQYVILAAILQHVGQLGWQGEEPTVDILIKAKPNSIL